MSAAQNAFRWLRQRLFQSVWHGLLTAVALGVVYLIGAPLVRWALLDARFGSTPESCAGIDGACWAFIANIYPFLLVGAYPDGERWRALVGLAILTALILATCIRRVRRWPPLYALWAAMPPVTFLLLYGADAIGLRVVSTDAWGGLLLTVVLSLVGVAFAFPLGLVLALGRRSRTMPAVRALCVAFIEVIRGVPLISILFLASVMVPLFLPAGITVHNILRAQVGIILFQSAYIAEVVRGGLQAVPRGQEEASASLGLRYSSTMALVILPQALRVALPALVNQFIIIVKDTSLVAVIGMFDLIGVAQVAIRNPTWPGKTYETYAFVALLYWTICFSISRVSLRLERHLHRGEA